MNYVECHIVNLLNCISFCFFHCTSSPISFASLSWFACRYMHLSLDFEDVGTCASPEDIFVTLPDFERQLSPRRCLDPQFACRYKYPSSDLKSLALVPCSIIFLDYHRDLSDNIIFHWSFDPSPWFACQYRHPSLDWGWWRLRLIWWYYRLAIGLWTDMRPSTSVWPYTHLNSDLRSLALPTHLMIFLARRVLSDYTLSWRCFYPRFAWRYMHQVQACGCMHLRLSLWRFDPLPPFASRYTHPKSEMRVLALLLDWKYFLSHR